MKEKKVVNKKINKNKKISISRLSVFAAIVIVFIYIVYATISFSFKAAGEFKSKISQTYTTKLEENKIKEIQKTEKVEIENTIMTRDDVISKITEMTQKPKEEIQIALQVKDDEEIKKISPKYEKAKRGDYIIGYDDMIIIFDPQEKIIVAKLK